MTKALASAAGEQVPRNDVQHSGRDASFRAMLPTGVAVVETRQSAGLDTLLAEERAAMTFSVPKRAAEFATGRWCARQAMGLEGIHGFPLLRNADRSPRWPPTIVGTITHTEGFCAAAVGHRDRFLGIGIDAEIDGRLHEELWPMLFTSGEIEWLDRLPAAQRASMATVLFSAKESFYKAQHSITHAWLDFNAATVGVDDAGWNLRLVRPEGALAQLRLPVRGQFAISDRLILTAIAIMRA